MWSSHSTFDPALTEEDVMKPQRKAFHLIQSPNSPLLHSLPRMLASCRCVANITIKKPEAILAPKVTEVAVNPPQAFI